MKQHCHFFSGLLPDEYIRRKIAKYLSISDTNIFGLLEAIGGECAGAVSLYPIGTDINNVDCNEYKVLTSDEASELLQLLDKRPLLIGTEDVRISGAGAQNKLIIALKDGNIAIPLKNSPSTHIIKPVIQELEHTVHNEYFCMQLAGLVGLPVPKTEIYWLDNKPYYLIKRYDRVLIDNKIIRLHQEDFCQALNILPEHKYEKEGGVSLQQSFSLLDERIKAGLMPGKTKIILLRAVIFNYLIGNGDAHGKNFSLLYKGKSEYLAPFYDLLCTVVYFNSYKSKMAMKLGGKYNFKDIGKRHFELLADEIGFRRDYVIKHLYKMLLQVEEEANKLYHKLMQNEKTVSPIYQDIIKVIKENIKTVQSV